MINNTIAVCLGAVNVPEEDASLLESFSNIYCWTRYLVAGRRAVTNPPKSGSFDAWRIASFPSQAGHAGHAGTALIPGRSTVYIRFTSLGQKGGLAVQAVGNKCLLHHARA